MSPWGHALESSSHKNVSSVGRLVIILRFKKWYKWTSHYEWVLHSPQQKKKQFAELCGVNYGVGRVGPPASQLHCSVNCGKCGTVRWMDHHICVWDISNSQRTFLGLFCGSPPLSLFMTVTTNKYFKYFLIEHFQHFHQVFMNLFTEFLDLTFLK